MKYIDADGLRALLIERYNVFKMGQHSPFRNGKTESLRETIELIDSLPQEMWKPSDEQLRPLEYAIDYFKKKRNDTTYLESLYNDLKKL